MKMANGISARWRVLGPLALAGGAIAPRGVAASDPATPQRETRNEIAGNPLSSLLALTPLSATGSTDNAQLASFADVAAQLAAGGIERPASKDDERMTAWLHASSPLILPDPFRSKTLRIDRAMLGLDVTDIDQSLEVGSPPAMISLLRGRFDREAVAAAWVANGYTMLEIDGVAVASLFEDATIDRENEISRLALARMNNAAFLPDGTLVYAATLPLMEAVIATADGAGEALMDRVDIAATLASLERPLASAMLVPGSALTVAAHTPIDLAAPEAVDLPNEMPPISFAIIGVTPGGPTVIYDEGEEPLITMPPATLVYHLLMTQPGSAEEAARVVDERLRTMTSSATEQPYADMFDSWEATALDNGNVLAIDLLPAEGRPTSFWPQLLFSRDLLFLAW